MRIALNGFGRIGRTVFRIINARDDIEIVAINDISPSDSLVYLLKYDTVMGRFPDTVELKGDVLVTSKNKVKMLEERNPVDLPWKELGIDVVIEATGIFRHMETLSNHLKAGAKRVILTVI